MLAGLKTFIAYWLLAGVISASFSMFLAVGGMYSVGANIITGFLGIVIAVGIYFYRRKK